MLLTISITGPDGSLKASARGEGEVTLVYPFAYEEGDVIRLSSSCPGHVSALLEDSMARTLGYLSGEFTLAVPFGEKRISYSPKSFTGPLHLLTARKATLAEVAARRNLCYNPLDSHDNTGFFPHAGANVETRGESVFAARNAIDGHYASASHGPWPYQSWGINRNPDAELTVHFGRDVTVDTLVVTLRADFPHDNWWKTATFTFSDGTEFVPIFTKTGKPQSFSIAPRTVRWLKLGRLLQDEDDPSPFPALTQLEAWGVESGH
jgi:hypothetical protein